MLSMETNKRKIEHLLIDKGMSKGDLAISLGITRQALWARINGPIKDIRVIEDIAERLGVDVKELLE